MREMIVMTSGPPLSPLEGGELSPFLDEDNHNGVSLTEQYHILETDEAPPAGFELQGPSSLQSISASHPMSDDEGDMLSDGGVQLNMSQTQTEVLDLDLDLETNMVDADGSENYASENYDITLIAQPHTFMEHDDGENNQESVEVNAEATQPPWLLGDDAVFPAHHVVNLPNEVLEVGQEVQDLQDGQEQDEQSAPPIHGLVYETMDDAQNNMPLADFLYSWSVNLRVESRKANRGPRLESLRDFRAATPTDVRTTDLRGDRCDLQGINWKKLEVKRRDARRLRIATYKNYQNLPSPPWFSFTLNRATLKNDTEDFFRFRRMNFKYKINLSHFQLRNLVACTSRNNVFFAGTSRVIQANPNHGQRCVRMNLSEPEVQPTHGHPWGGVQISTIAADHDVLIAGGFHGEYGMTALSRPESKHIEGLVVDHPNCITNHIEIQLSRQSGLPEAVIASNDNGIRTLDCTTNKFTRHHEYDHAINCTAQSPDRRLRVLVGDTCNVMICNAESGEVLQKLDGHFDYGFACAWADNGWHVATGNQDQLVKIWDARMWTTSDGRAKSLATIASTMAGVRSLKYSPLGSGKRVLLASEPADIISVIDAETYESKQTLDLFGEIAGTDFTPDGQNIFVGVHDSLRGGLMEFEKCGFGRSYYQENTFRKRDLDVDMYDSEGNEATLNEMAAGLDWRRTMEEVVADPKSRRTATHRRRRAARLGDLDAY